MPPQSNRSWSHGSARFAAANFALEARGEVEFDLLDDGIEVVASSLGRPGGGPPTLEGVREAARGLNLSLEGGVARVKDQLYVPRDNIADEEVLRQRRQLGTDFEFDLEVWSSFTFGSVTNNVVNPRMGNGRGRRFF